MTLPLQTVVVIAATAAVVGAVALYLAAAVISGRKKRKKRRGRNTASAASVSAPPTTPKKKSLLSRLWAKVSGIGTMNVILLVCGGALFAFTWEMIELFKQYGMVPDTLVTCVFATLTRESGELGGIKTSKVKHQERRWQKEDMREANMAAQMPAVDPSAEGTPKE